MKMKLFSDEKKTLFCSQTLLQVSGEGTVDTFPNVLTLEPKGIKKYK